MLKLESAVRRIWIADRALILSSCVGEIFRQQSRAKVIAGQLPVGEAGWAQMGYFIDLNPARFSIFRQLGASDYQCKGQR